MKAKSLLFSQEYYLIFTQGRTHWITRWLKPNFSHIYLITKDDFNWLLINPTRGYLQHLILPVPITQSPLPRMVHAFDTVLHLEFSKRDDTRQFGSVGMFNCVTWSKYVLGLRLNCLTPFGLYKRLVNFDADERLKHSLISVREIPHDWSRNAVEQIA